jgi:hypothetical protein
MTMEQPSLVDRCLTKRNFYIAITGFIILISIITVLSSFTESRVMKRILDWLVLDIPLGTLIGFLLFVMVDNVKQSKDRFFKVLGIALFLGVMIEGFVLPQTDGIIANTFNNDIRYEYFSIWSVNAQYYLSTPAENAMHDTIHKLWTSIGLITLTIGGGAAVVLIQKFIRGEID